MAFALGALNDRAPSPALVDAYEALVQYIFESASPGPLGGLRLNEYTGLRWGTAGIGLFLLQVRVVSESPFLKLTRFHALTAGCLEIPASPKRGGPCRTCKCSRRLPRLNCHPL